jgi:hypothetical protein
LSAKLFLAAGTPEIFIDFSFISGIVFVIFLCLTHHFHCPSNDVGCNTRCLAGHDVTVDASAAIRVLQYWAITTILPPVTSLLEGGYPAAQLRLALPWSMPKTAALFNLQKVQAAMK